ncbi:hypothetical protein MPK70_gp031 [Erwinia phage pEa_SNUABM_33]|uniref:Uncharacterized protein n=1 Tax=Erwinia phage pEa_SNUABM_33 TaxID=2869556 RepID=A0AAE7XKF6_9CAUD|nr:hypothetical protein MPK70_gp031 [Erwinia phage pEa_SNUABM_33]QZE57907.1 hypothetical protein pEaSNUABM33_00031 [Erwinia phage pEa_SNUABM_33]
MKEFLSKYFDLREYDSWPLGLMFLGILWGMASDFLFDYNAIWPSIVVVAIYSVAVVLDVRKIMDSGNTSPSWGWLLFIPIYLWKRDTLTKKKNRNIFWAWMLLCVISFGTSFLAMSKDNNVQVEQDVCRILNTLDSLKENDVTCVRAYNMEEQYDGYWKGSAHLSNNRDVNVSADYNKQQGMVYVQIHSLLGE